MPHIHRVNRAEKSPRKNEWEAGTEGSSAGRRIHAGLAARDRHGRGHRVLLGRGGRRGSPTLHSLEPPKHNRLPLPPKNISWTSFLQDWGRSVFKRRLTKQLISQPRLAPAKIRWVPPSKLRGSRGPEDALRAGEEVLGSLPPPLRRLRDRGLQAGAIERRRRSSDH